MALESGTRFRPYEVVEPIGSGGMGEVWLARDTKLKRDVAVKVLPESFATDADSARRPMMAVTVETDTEFSFGASEPLFSERFLFDSNPYQPSYDIAGDGRFIMLRATEDSRNAFDSADIVVVLNWFEELRQRAPTD